MNRYSKGTQPTDSQAGFTIVELMIATIVFSIVLMLVTIGLLQISRTYYKGITTAKTQQVTRSIMDQISQSIQFSASGANSVTFPSATPAPSTPTAFCINNTRYTYQLDKQLSDTPDSTQTKHVLVADTYAGCPGSTSPIPDLNNSALNLATLNSAQELMGANMRLAQLTICLPGTVTQACPNPPAANSSLYQVTVTVVAGHNDILAADHQHCSSSLTVTQFCAVSTLSTMVQKRLN